MEGNDTNAAYPTSPDAGAFVQGQTALPEHGRSTFPGEPGRGGWVPILSQRDDERPRITDWICPTCHQLTGQSRSCSHCGLIVMDRPIKRREKHNYRAWAAWGYDLFDNDEPESLRRIR